MYTSYSVPSDLFVSLTSPFGTISQFSKPWKECVRSDQRAVLTANDFTIPVTLDAITFQSLASCSSQIDLKGGAIFRAMENYCTVPKDVTVAINPVVIFTDYSTHCPLHIQMANLLQTQENILAIVFHTTI